MQCICNAMQKPLSQLPTPPRKVVHDRVDPEISLSVMWYSPSRHDQEYTIPQTSKKRPPTIEQTSKEKKTSLYLTILGMSVTNRHRNRLQRPGESPLSHFTHSILTATRISLIATRAYCLVLLGTSHTRPAPVSSFSSTLSPFRLDSLPCTPSYSTKQTRNQHVLGIYASSNQPSHGQSPS